MHLSLSMSNVLHQCIGDSINIIYEPLGNIFDQILFLSNENSNFYIIDHTTTKYNTLNAKILPPSFVDFYSYNLYISNNPLSSINNNLSHVFHTNSLLIFHYDKPNTLKKEDRAIINSKIKNNTKIFFDKQYMENWQINNKTNVFSYGVPLEHIPYSTNCINREKDVMIIGDNQSVINRSLQQAFQTNNISCDILSLHQPNIDVVNSILNTYKICIDLNSSCCINCLCACAAGCYAVHNGSFTSDLPSVIQAKSAESIVSLTQNILQNYKATDHLKRVADDRSVLARDYNFDIFKGHIQRLIQNLSKNEVYTV